MAISNIFKTKYSEWKTQWQDKRVQAVGSDYDFLSAESTLLVSGPPEWDETLGDSALIPVGLVQNANISQNKMIQQLYEVGSREMFTIPGRTFCQVSIARIMFDGPSLLFTLNSYYNSNGKVMIPQLSDAQSENTSPYGKPTNPYPENFGEGYQEVDPATISDNELGPFWGNLGSSIFNRPMGLGFIFMDTQSDFYGGLYLEKSFIQSYNMGISSQQTILLENVQVRVTKVKPIRVV